MCAVTVSAKSAVWLHDKLPGSFCLPVCILCPQQPLKERRKLHVFEGGWLNGFSLNNNRGCFVGWECALIGSRLFSLCDWPIQWRRISWGWTQQESLLLSPVQQLSMDPAVYVQTPVSSWVLGDVVGCVFMMGAHPEVGRIELGGNSSAITKKDAWTLVENLCCSSWFQVSCGKVLLVSWLVQNQLVDLHNQPLNQPGSQHGDRTEECNPSPSSLLLLAAAREHTGANIPSVAHYSLLDQWEEASN